MLTFLFINRFKCCYHWSRRFQRIVTEKYSVEIEGTITENVISISLSVAL